MASAEPPELSKGRAETAKRPLYPPLSSAVRESYHMAGAGKDQASRTGFLKTQRAAGRRAPKIQGFDESNRKQAKHPENGLSKNALSMS